VQWSFSPREVGLILSELLFLGNPLLPSLAKRVRKGDENTGTSAENGTIFHDGKLFGTGKGKCEKGAFSMRGDKCLLSPRFLEGD